MNTARAEQVHGAAVIVKPATSPRMAGEQASRRAFFGFSVLLFAASAAVTVVWSTAMPAMNGMTMPGGWTMSMTWMPMPGQTWPDTAASFLGMWIVMMTAMMLPSLAPALWRFRQAIGRASAARSRCLTALAAVAYFIVWTVFGINAFALGAVLTAIETRLPAVVRLVPLATGAIVLIAGAMQFAPWKARHLACCREMPRHDRLLPAHAGTAWRYGLSLGRHCSYSSAGPTIVLLVMGVMDLRVMAVVTAAITIERLMPAGERVARGIGVVAISAGLWLITHSCGLG